MAALLFLAAFGCGPGTEGAISRIHPLVCSYQTTARDPRVDAATHEFLREFANTYDQALVVIEALQAGAIARAREILDHFQRRDGAPPRSNKEGEVVTGEALWLGIAAAHYSCRAGGAEFQPLLQRIGELALRLQQPDGRILGGPQVSWASTEHNLDALAFLGMMRELTGASAYREAQVRVAKWLVHKAYLPREGRFRRGQGDPLFATDTSSFGVAALAAVRTADPGLFRETGLDRVRPKRLVRAAERRSLVRAPYRPGEAASLPMTLFRFEGDNPSSPRSFEWSAQMALAYGLIGERKAARALLSGVQGALIAGARGETSLPYAAEAGPAFRDHGWVAVTYPSVAATIWYRWALRGFNPFSLGSSMGPPSRNGP